MKRALIVVAVLVVVAVAGTILYLLHNLDAIVKAAIEREGSAITGTAVSVGSVEIALTEGRGTIRNLRIANPPGFETPDAFSLGEITLAIDPKSVTSQPIVVNTVTIDSPTVVFELDDKARANLQVIQEHVTAATTGGGGGGTGGGGPEPRLAVRRFTFEKGALEANTEAVGGKTQRVEAPPLRLADLGGRRGATGAELGKQVLAAYLEQVLKTVARQQLGSQADRLIQEKLGSGQEGEAARKLLDRVLKPEK